MFYQFRGGVYPSHRKSATRKKDIAALPVPDRVVLSLDPTGREVCAPMVSVGDIVHEGQLIGQPSPDGVPVYASIPGRVAEIEGRATLSGRRELCCVITREGDDGGPPERLELGRMPGQMTPEELWEAVRLTGVGVMDGGEPLHRRLRAAYGRVRTLVLNGCESEPLLTADHRLMAARPETVLEGAKVLLAACGAEECIIAVEGNKADAIWALQDRIPLRGSKIRVRTFRAKYPQGAEKLLVYGVTGTELPLGGHDVDAGCLVVGVAAASAIADGLFRDMPFTGRVVTVAGSAVERPRNLRVPLGTPLDDLLKAAKGCKEAPRCFVVGGPMTGIQVSDLSLGVRGDTPGLLALGEKEPDVRGERPVCLRCGRCADVCPMRLLPAYFHMYRDNPAMLNAYHIQACMECGTCSYVCPSRIPLTREIRRAKTQGEGGEQG